MYAALASSFKYGGAVSFFPTRTMGRTVGTCLKHTLASQMDNLTFERVYIPFEYGFG